MNVLKSADIRNKLTVRLAEKQGKVNEEATRLT
jgi:hypothetical protein